MKEPLATSFATRLWSHQWMRWLLLILVIIFIIYVIQQRSSKHEPDRQIPTVSFALVENKKVSLYESALGNVTATGTITVKTQINGLLMNVLFKEGQIVKAGEVLAEIDRRPLLAQLTQYQGQLARDEALLANALIDLKRYETLWKQNSVSQQILATQKSLVKQYQGATEIDKGLIESTNVSLIYTRITAPVAGRIGLRLVDPGNVVQISDTTGIAVLTTLNPITVLFSIPADALPEILQQMKNNQPVIVKAYNRQQNKLLATGTLLATDSLININTGTIMLKAQFENKENALFPNQFVNIKVLVNQLPNAVVVKTAAIQHGRKNDFVFLLNSDFTVTVKSIKVGVTSGDDTIVEDGLRPGQQVVVDGADKLTSGARVKIIKK